ncbi:MAG: hypothetical protein F6K16_34590 [Symploca sp. SIO2B6]|nr:hypothetical protein [Symploca sp. SIO2B6]
MPAWISTRQQQKSIPMQNRWISIWLGILLALASCTDNKVAQCNELILTINQTEQELYNITQTSKADINALGDIAETTRRAVTDLETLELSSSRLQDFKRQFLAFYGNISNDATTIVDAHGEQNMTEADAAYNRLEQTFQGQALLVDNVNAYCSEGYEP